MIMGKIKTISENKREINTIKPGDMDKASDAFWEEESKKEEALKDISGKTYASISNVIGSVIKGDKNTVFSPVAMYLALIVLGEITKGKTKEQIDGVTGVTKADAADIYKAIKTVAQSICGYATSNISSSMWFGEGTDYNHVLLDKLSEQYQISSYEGKMGTKEMNDAISEWINNATGNVLAEQMNIQTTEDMLLDFFTTIHFCSSWNNGFWKTRTSNFTLESGEKVKCQMMHGEDKTLFHEGKKFKALTKKLNGGYDAIFVLPNKGVSTSDIVCDSQVNELVSNGYISSSERCDVTFSMPMFDIASKIDLINIMKELGITDVFSPESADFGPMSSAPGLCLSKAEQTTRITMDEEGVEAASCVEMGVMILGLPPKDREVKFTLNRPFLFFITANNKLPIIAGKVMNPIIN